MKSIESVPVSDEPTESEDKAETPTTQPKDTVNDIDVSSDLVSKDPRVAHARMVRYAQRLVSFRRREK